MYGITKFIEEDLKLKVHKDRSKVDRPWKLKYLRFSFYNKKNEMGIRVHNKSVEKLKATLKKITRRSNAISMEYRAVKLEQTITGWINYLLNLRVPNGTHGGVRGR